MSILLTCKYDGDPIKMKALSCPQLFRHYNSMGKYFGAQGRVNPWPIFLSGRKLNFIRYFVPVIVTCKLPVIFLIISLWELLVTMEHLIKIGQRGSEISMGESVDDGRRQTDRCYTISPPCEPSAQVS